MKLNKICNFFTFYILSHFMSYKNGFSCFKEYIVVVIILFIQKINFISHVEYICSYVQISS